MAKFAAFFAVVLFALVPIRMAWGVELPNAFRCHFNHGGAWIHQDGKYTEETVKALDLHIVTGKSGSASAVLKTAEGSARLKHVAALDANHYLEVTVGGYLNITTIFDQISKEGGYPAVHSRHFGVLGKPLVSQYRGICRPAK